MSSVAASSRSLRVRQVVGQVASVLLVVVAWLAEVSRVFTARGALLVVALCAGLAIGLSPVLAIWLMLGFTGIVIIALLTGGTALATEGANLATYALAAAILFAAWEHLVEHFDIPLPLAVVRTRFREWRAASGAEHAVVKFLERALHWRPLLYVLLGGIALPFLLLSTSVSARSALGAAAMRRHVPLAALDVGPFKPVVRDLTAGIPTVCALPETDVALALNNPYVLLALYRPDVLQFYQNNGWDPQVQCSIIYDNWLASGQAGSPPLTAAQYVVKEGWTKSAVAPDRGCTASPQEIQRLGFDPYKVLQQHRSDVLKLYASNNQPHVNIRWNPATQCVSIFNDWLKHPDGGPPTTAAAFVIAQGWAVAK